jgi:hypothetical protein
MKKELIIEKMILIIITVLLFAGCSKDDNNTNPVNDKGEFTLVSVYDSIRSYPDGGGILIAYISTSNDFEGKVLLRLAADSSLRCKLSKPYLTKQDTLVEIIINPISDVQIEEHSIKLIATHNKNEKSIELKINILPWSSNYWDAKAKLSMFKEHIIAFNSKFVQIFDNSKFIYATYPQILIVEHFTFLTMDYEIRLCYHVMIPPYDWSKICIRNRNSTVPEVAFLRETDGKIREISIAEYPKLLGY